jgi:uncharacterized protein YggT (Ycf19 family)
METEKLEADESRRIEQHERIKSRLEADVHERISREGSRPSPGEEAQAASLAREMKGKAAREVAETERDLDRTRTVNRAAQVVDYVFFLVYGLIGLEIVLELLGARQRSGFKQFLDAVTWPLLAPFRGLMPDPAVGSFQLMLSFIVALVVYFFLHRAVVRLMRVMVERKSSL